jgi:hypothetical protein
MPPPGIRVLQLPEPIAKFFATLPWAHSALHRRLEKAELFVALCKKDVQEVDRIVARLHQRDANGLRHWRWQSLEQSSKTCRTRAPDAETDTTT